MSLSKLETFWIPDKFNYYNGKFYLFVLLSSYNSGPFKNNIKLKNIQAPVLVKNEHNE